MVDSASEDACPRCLGSVKTVDGTAPPSSAEVSDLSPWSTCRHRPDFPPGLANLSDPPPVLFGLGERRHLARLVEGSVRVTLIGARAASREGLEIAEALGRDLAGAGVVVVSGMARGIDSAAHRGALEAEGDAPTVAVLGSGADVCYPIRERALYERIIARGLVLSELPPGSEPRSWTFPSRNRLMAALGQMTVVVEARKSSGSLITASMAADVGREIGAVPGSVISANGAGVNALLRDGAHVIRDAQDVLDSLPISARAATRPASAARRLPEALAEILEAVERSPGSVDEISHEQSAPVREVATALAKLELAGYVRRDGSGRFVRTALAPGSGLFL